MPTFLFLLLILVPALEIASIVVMTQQVGGALTFALVILGAVLGFFVMRHAGRSWWASLRASAGVPDAAGVATAPQPPDVRQAADRGLLFLGGLLLAIPGFVGDVVGLLLLFPFARSGLRVVAAAWFLRRFSAVSAPGGFVVWEQDGRPRPPGVGESTVSVEQIIPGEVIRGEVLPGPAAPAQPAQPQVVDEDPDSRTAPPLEPRGG